MKKIIEPKKQDWETILARPTKSIENLEESVNTIFEDISRNGDDAIKRYTSIFDGVLLKNTVVSSEEFVEANEQVSKKLKLAIAIAKANIEKFHISQKSETKKIETTSGVICWQEERPIDKVGLYIPGGTAPLFSTVLMLAIPAKIAGCKEIILCTPPNKKGKIHSAILYAAQLCGVTKVIKVGGIQAIAGLTFGTNSISKVYKIYGPGNQYVTAAKQLATKYGVAIDMPAGPSELLIMADAFSNPTFVAADLLSQAEHGTDSQVILISTNKELLTKVEKELNTQLEKLPRKEIAKVAIKNSKLIYIKEDKTALELINTYAPEHLIIYTKNEKYYTSGISNAGSVFIGKYATESAGDYASGTNHTLPTNGFAKAYSGITLGSFQKTILFQKILEEGIKNLGNTIEILAEAEGLQAHKNAVSVRLKAIK